MASLGERIWRLRTTLRKTQGEFALILGSQQNSVSRYEKDKVVPGIAVLSKLHDLADAEDKQAFADEIRKQVGSTIIESIGLPEDPALQGVAARGSIKELRPIIAGMAEIQKQNSLITAGRKDKAGLLWAASTLADDQRIDDSLIEILMLCVHCRKQKGAATIFRKTAAFLRARIAASEKKTTA
jgi:transcriptional regulator with XRE-family HTH domain